MSRVLLSVALCCSFTVVVARHVAAHAHSAAERWHTVGFWGMNESQRPTLLDGSTNHLTGHIGDKVGINGHTHVYSRTSRDAVLPQHVDTVPDSDLLDPGTDPFTVTARVKFGAQRDRNIVQKGQGDPDGGLFKMKLAVKAPHPMGGVWCLFRGVNADSTVNSYSIPSLADKTWHVVTCGRTVNGTFMRVDGKVVDRNSNDPGSISNTWPLAIGGNSACDGTVDRFCNYLAGRIDYVRMRER